MVEPAAGHDDTIQAQGLADEEIDTDKFFFDDNQALRDDLLMTEQECQWKRSGASLGRGGLAVITPVKQRPGYRSDAYYTQVPQRLRKRTQDPAATISNNN